MQHRKPHHKPMRAAIVAMTRDNVIGVDGKLAWHYRTDLQRFKQRTLGAAVIMGRVTWQSIECRALPQRRNIVISRSAVADVEHYKNVEAAIAACKTQDLWIIGGGQIYRAAMQYVDVLDVTWVPDVITRTDAVRFPRIDETAWRVESETELADGLVSVVYRRVKH